MNQTVAHPATTEESGKDITVWLDRENFNLDSTLAHQADQVRNKERNTGVYREPQADVEQQGWETPPHKPGPLAALGEGHAASRAGTGSGGTRASLTRTAPGRAGRTGCQGTARSDPCNRGLGARRASAAGSEEPEAATGVGRRREAQLPVHRASESRRWLGAVDNLVYLKALLYTRDIPSILIC